MACISYHEKSNHLYLILKRLFLIFIVLIVVFGSNTIARAQMDTPSHNQMGGQSMTPEQFKKFQDLISEQAEKINNKVEQQTKKQEEEQSTKKFAGIDFGAGIGLSLSVGKKKVIDQAEVVNGIVRVSRERDEIPRLLFETHYLFLPKETNFLYMVEPELWGWGPFIAVQSSEEQTIDSVGFGLLLGFRRSKDATTSFNIGVGVVYDSNVKVLGDGIKENQPLPAGETTVRFKEISEMSWLLIGSFGF